MKGNKTNSRGRVDRTKHVAEERPVVTGFMGIKIYRDRRSRQSVGCVAGNWGGPATDIGQTGRRDYNCIAEPGYTSEYRI